MKELKVISPLDSISKRPRMFFGKENVDGFDLLKMVMEDLGKITEFRCVIHDDDLFVVSSAKDWISEHYGDIDTFLKEIGFSKDELDYPKDIHWGVLLFVFSSIVSVISGKSLVSYKGYLSNERIETLMKKYNLPEEGFYFIFSL